MSNIRKTQRKNLAFDIHRRGNTLAFNNTGDSVTQTNKLRAGEDIYVMAICINDDGAAFLAHPLSPALAIATDSANTGDEFTVIQSGMIRIPGAEFEFNKTVFLTSPVLTSPNLTTDINTVNSGEYLQVIGHSISSPVGTTTDWMIVSIGEPELRE